MIPAEVAAACSRARAGFETWRRTGVLDRAAVLARCAGLIRARLTDGATIVVRENGKTLVKTAAVRYQW
jgi:acyl-CoA reductase-like NAD-dependent aldehyde dehydrogenase